MSNHTNYRDLTKDERHRFGWFLFRENREPLHAFHPEYFWVYYEANIEAIEYLSFPILYPNYFADGDLIRTFIADDDEWTFPSVFWWFKQKRDGTFERLTPQTVPETHNGALICVCGNTADHSGFYPCNEIGSEVEPTHEGWKKSLYCCDVCGRIINYDALQVEGFRQPNHTR